MSERDDYWRDVTRALAQDGPATVPPDLAGRAFDAAMQAERTGEVSLLAALLRLARPVTATALVAASLLFVVGLARGNVSTTTSTPTLYELVVGDDASADVTTWLVPTGDAP